MLVWPHICSFEPPHVAFQAFRSHIQLLVFCFVFEFFRVSRQSGVFVCCFPGPCPLSPCRAWWESAMRGSAGINLGNLISGAVVPALNISISPGWLLGAGAGPVMASSWGEREGERGVCVFVWGGGWWLGVCSGKTRFDKQISPTP